MRVLLLLATLGIASAVSAQPVRLPPGAPSPDRLVLPALDAAALRAQSDAARIARDAPGPVRFAEPIDVRVDAPRRGGWAPAPGGGRVWRLVVEAPGAYSLSFGFTRFRLPEGARLWISPEGGTPEYRPFTSEDNEAHGQLWTPLVPGARAVIQLDLPPTKAGAADDVELVLGRVNAAFRPTLLTQAEKDAQGISARVSGSCNVDVVCPEGDGYRDIIRSVGAYTVGGIDYCSGAAVNTTAGDDRSLFLTANHCGITAGNQAAVVVYWNYQNATCRTPGSGASGASGNGSRAQFNSGTVELGDGAASDWSALEFDDPILPDARVFLAGWDRRDVAPPSAVAIHHPGVEEKRISFENDATSITTYSSDAPSAAGTHIRVADWDLGTTEGGSSGSPLFDDNQRIVGQLHGGGAACGNNQPDWYGRLHRSMNDGLAAILDPAGTGADAIDGVNYAPLVFADASVSDPLIAPGESTTVTFTVGNPTEADVASSAFTATIPAGLSYAGALGSTRGTAVASGAEVTWTGALEAGSDLMVSFDVAADGDAPDGVYSVGSVTSIGGGQPDLLADVTVAVVSPRPEPTFFVEATPAAAIPDNGCSSGFSANTLDVAEDVELARVSLGVNLTHTYRGDLRLRLSSPGGRTVEVLSRPGTGGFGTSADNLDVVFDAAGTVGALGGTNHNVAAPYYDQDVAPESGDPGVGVGSLTTFIGERSAGTWTLGVCDGAGQDTGTLNRWALFLVDADGGAVATEGPTEAAPLTAELVGANPLSAETRVRVRVRQPGAVRATLVDATGRTVGVLFEGEVRSTALFAVEASGLSSGTYFVRVEAAGGRATLPVSVVR